MEDTRINFSLLSTGEIERIVDKGLRHKSGLQPRDYLKHWLFVARHFGYATHDDSWGEFEKEFAIIIKRLVVAERELDAMRLVKAPAARHRPYFRFWRWLTRRDNCECCDGRKGVRGNENVIRGLVMCDYCHADTL